MNEKYTPIAVRFGVIVVALVIGGVALTKYVGGREDTFLEAEIAKAKSLGWLEIGGPDPVSDAEQATVEKFGAAYSALVNSLGKQEKYLILRPDRWFEQRGIAIASARTDRAAQILSEGMPELEEAVKKPFFLSSKLNHSERRILTYALAARARSFANDGKAEPAFGTLRLACLLSNVIKVAKPLYADELDSVVRVTWCQIALQFPKATQPFPASTFAMEYGKSAIGHLIVTQFGGQGKEPVEETMGAKRERFDNLRTGSTAYQELQSEGGTDLYSLWEFLQARNATYLFSRGGVSTSDPVNLEAFIRNQAIREQLTDLFYESVKNGGESPAGMSKSRDPFNTSKPLKYRKYPDGYAIYSVGPDGVDGKGKQGDMSIKVSNGKARASLETDGTWR